MKRPKPNRAAITDAAGEQEYTEQLAEIESRKVRKRPDRQIQATEGTNKRFLTHNMRLMRLEPLTIDRPAQEIENRIFEYFQICLDDDQRPTIQGLSLALGIDRRRLWEVYSGTMKRQYSAETTAIIKRAYGAIVSEIEGLMIQGSANPVPCIFLLKNHANYTDRQEISLAATEQTEHIQSAEELDRKYADAVPVDYTPSDWTDAAEDNMP